MPFAYLEFLGLVGFDSFGGRGEVLFVSLWGFFWFFFLSFSFFFKIDYVSAVSSTRKHINMFLDDT